jgi:hypothetical protein
MATLGRSKPSTDARAAGRSYLTTSSFNTSIYSYITTVDYTTNITNGVLSTVSAATVLNCPKGRILRETGRKLYPGINPGISSMMVSIYDDTTMFTGYIDPNSRLYTVFNSDKASFIPNNNQLGSPVYTRGSVESLEEVSASTMFATSRIKTPVAETSSILTSTFNAAGTAIASIFSATSKVVAPLVEATTVSATARCTGPLVEATTISTSLVTALNLNTINLTASNINVSSINASNTNTSNINTNNVSSFNITTFNFTASNINTSNINTLSMTTSNATTYNLYGTNATTSNVTTNQLYLPASSITYVTPGIAPIMGTANLVSGVVNVYTSACTPTSYIFVSYSGATANPGYLTTTNVSAGSFRINSSSGIDSSYVNWLIVQPF